MRADQVFRVFSERSQYLQRLTEAGLVSYEAASVWAVNGLREPLCRDALVRPESGGKPRHSLRQVVKSGVLGVCDGGQCLIKRLTLPRPLMQMGS
jgi:hypothetical protein